MSITVSPIGSEVLDGPSCSPELARATLLDIARSNLLLGGRAAAWFGVRRLLASRSAPAGREGSAGRALTLLDVGAGGGDIAAYVVRRARDHGAMLIPVTLDRHRAAAALCRQKGLASLVADGCAPPIGAGSVDIIIASQLLHHFGRDAAVALLRALAPLARLGVVVADLRRAHAAALGIWLAGLALGFHPVTRQDGVTSVRRGFTTRGLSELLLAAGMKTPVYRRPGYRLVAAWRADRADD